LGDTRTEDDFVVHIQATIATDPKAKWVFIADQLNTHKSASWVKCVTELCGIETPLGEVAQFRLAYSRQMFVIAYPRETQEMVDGNGRA